MARIISEGTSRVTLIEDSGREVVIIDTFDQRLNRSGSAYRGVTLDGGITHIKIDMLANRYSSWLSEGMDEDEAMIRLVMEGLITSDMRLAGRLKQMALIDMNNDYLEEVASLITNYGSDHKVVSLKSDDYSIYRSNAFDIVIISATPGLEKEQLIIGADLVREEGRIIVLSQLEMSEKVIELFVDDNTTAYHINNKLSVHHIDSESVRRDILMPMPMADEINRINERINDVEGTDDNKDELYNTILRINELIARSIQVDDYKSKQYLIEIKESLQNQLLGFR